MLGYNFDFLCGLLLVVCFILHKNQNAPFILVNTLFPTFLHWFDVFFCQSEYSSQRKVATISFTIKILVFYSATLTSCSLLVGS